MTTSPLNVTVPPEPPNGSVVLDTRLRAWQRAGNTWALAAGALSLFAGHSWPHLLLSFGPVELIWQPRPEVDEEPAPADDEPDDESLIVHIVEADDVHDGVLHIAATDRLARDWITDYGAPAYPGLTLTVTAREVDHG